MLEIVMLEQQKRSRESRERRVLGRHECEQGKRMMMLELFNLLEDCLQKKYKDDDQKTLEE